MLDLRCPSRVRIARKALAWIGAITLSTSCSASPPTSSGAGPATATPGSSTSAAASRSSGPDTARVHHHVSPDLAEKIDAYFAADVAGHYRNRRAIVVTVDGRVVATRYLKSAPASTYDIQTIGGTIVTLLVGIALQEGKIRSLDQTLPELLPAYAPVMTKDDKAITLRQLLTQNSGLPTDDAFYPKIWALPPSTDWVRQILTTGPTQPPGGELSLSSAASHLVSAILTQATGQSTLDYARVKLFQPLGISTTGAYQGVFIPSRFPAYQHARFAWPTDPQGVNLGGGSLKMTATDLAKIGQLLLDQGRWAGRQLIPRQWTTSAESPLQTVGYEADGAPIGFGYNNIFDAKITGHRVFATLALGGQIIEAVTDLGIVVTVLSQSPVSPIAPADPGTTGDGSDYDDFVSTVVEPAVH